MSDSMKNVVLLLLSVAVAAFAVFALKHGSGTPSALATASAPPTVVASTGPSPSPSATGPLGHLDHVAQTQTPKVAFLGSSLTAGCCTSRFGTTWPYLIQQRLDAHLGVKATYTRHVFPGTSLPNIIRQGGVAATVADQPDMVIFEPATPNDCGQGVTRAQSLSLLSDAITTLRAGLPNATIIVQTPNPNTHTASCTAGDGTYEQRVAAEATFLRGTRGIDFFDLYAAMKVRVGTALQSYLHDDTHPNDRGAALWADLLGAHLGI